MQIREVFDRRRFVLLDGGMGTQLQSRGLQPGEKPELAALTMPDTLTAIHRDYAAAGADILLANTFGANAKKLAGCGYTLQQVIQASLACARTAADALGVDDERSRALVRFAELLGLCFQMRDDVFDYYSDPAVGKPTGNDLREGKVTLPLLHVLADETLPLHEAMNTLVRSGSLTATEIDTLTTYAKTYGGIEYTYARMAELRAEGVEALACLPETEDKQRLIAIFDYIITRNH